jgi:hypothetical protein
MTECRCALCFGRNSETKGADAFPLLNPSTAGWLLKTLAGKLDDHFSNVFCA